MADRKMTEKGFLHKAKGKVSATAFIAQHREWLVTGTLAPLTTPVLAKLDSGEIYPTQALGDLCQAVMGHMVARHIFEGENKIDKAPASTGTGTGTRTGTSKPYTATVYDESGNIQCVLTRDTEDAEKDLVSYFDCHHKAQGWCDRRLDQGGPGWYATIVDNATGNVIERIDRDASLHRLYSKRPGSGVATKKVATASGGLSWRMKAKGDHFHFSKG